jgi:hypothetical protein
VEGQPRPGRLNDPRGTAVPGLTAKPVVDILIGIDDPDDDAAHLPTWSRRATSSARR